MWLTNLAIKRPVAILMLIALPTGSVIQLGAHAGLLVCGAGIALALKPREDDHEE